MARRTSGFSPRGMDVSVVAQLLASAVRPLDEGLLRDAALIVTAHSETADAARDTLSMLGLYTQETNDV